MIKYDGDPVSLYEFLSNLEAWEIKFDVKLIIPGIMCAIMVVVWLFALAELTGSSKKRISYTRNIKDCWTVLVIGSVGMVIAYVSVLLWAIPELVKDIFVFEQLFYISLIVSMVTLLISMVMLIVFGVLGKKFKNTDDYKRYLKSAEIFNENAIKKNAFHPYSKKNWVIALICALILTALILIAPLSLGFLTVGGSTLVLASPLLFLALIYFMVCYRRCYCTEKPFLKKRLQAWTLMVIMFGVSIVMLLLGFREMGAIVSVFPILGGVFSIIEIAIIRKYLKRGY